MGNEEYIDSYDKSARMSKSLKEWLIKEFGKNENIIGRTPGADYLVKTKKVFGGKTHYYFNIPSFFDPVNGFISCLRKMYEQYLKRLKSIEEDKFISFVGLLCKPYDYVIKYLGWENDSAGRLILDHVYSFALGLAFGCGVVAIGSLLSRIHPLLGAAVVVTTIVIEIRSIGRIKAYENCEKDANELFKRIFGYIKDPNYLKKLEEINVIEIADTENSNSLLEGIFQKGIEINYWYIPNIENAKTLNQFEDRARNFYSDCINAFKNDNTKYVLSEIRDIEKKYDDSYKLYKKNLTDIKSIEDELEKLKISDPDNPVVQLLLKKLNKQ